MAAKATKADRLAWKNGEARDDFVETGTVWLVKAGIWNHARVYRGKDTWAQKEFGVIGGESVAGVFPALFFCENYF